jgi:hypothetical protein
VLDKTSLAENFSGLPLVHWRVQQNKMMEELKEESK